MQIETISRGAQFKGFVSFIGLFFFVFTFIISIVMLVHSSILTGTGFLIASVVFLSLFLDIRGTQFDYANKKVRAYRQFLWIRYGEWMPLDHFGEIHIGKDTFHVSTYLGPVTGSRAKVVSFDVVLIAALREHNILLSEFSNINEGIEFMNKIAQKLGIPARNIYRELQESAVSRRNARR